jgi:hypothetical protein
VEDQHVSLHRPPVAELPGYRNGRRGGHLVALIGFLGGLAVGASLGLIGAGGAVLALPLFLALGAETHPAIASSLLVVGATAGVAAAGRVRTGDVAWRTALLFAPATMLGGFAGGRLAGALPESLLLHGFTALLLGAAGAMWRAKPPPAGPAGEGALGPARGLAVALAGGLIGALTGMVGAGGGFLFVPALAVGLGLPMPRAIGTSLVVIACNAFAALLGHLGHVALDARLAGPVAAGALAGALAGGRLSAGASERALRRGFALFLLAVAGWLLARG